MRYTADMQKTAFFDLDYTLYEGYTASALLRFLADHGHIKASLADEIHQLHEDYSAGLINYRDAAERALKLNAAVVAGKTEAEVAEWTRRFVHATSDRLYPWTDKLMRILHEKGYKVCIISASMDFTVKAVAEVLGADRHYGSVAEVESGVYTGELTHLLNFEEKHAIVQKLLQETQHETHVGFGDSEGDVDMLSAMDKAVLYNPKSPDLVTLAHERGWFIASEDTILDYARDHL